MSVNFISASDYSIGDGAMYALIGFVIVIAVLALLVGIFYFSGFLFKTKALSGDELFKRNKKQPDGAMSADAEDEQTVAAITAAIAVVLSEENGDEDVKPEFVIRRVTRK